MTESPTLLRGRNFCRACSSTKLFVALELGMLPIANELTRCRTNNAETFELTLSICENCGLGQIGEYVSPDRLFEDYGYLSSMSSSFLRHSEQFATETLERIPLTVDDYILEIASNDGYLLSFFQKFGFKVLGIEPAKNVAKIAVEKGINTISDFFGNKLANEILQDYGYPRLVVANNVLAHVPDIKDFLLGLSILAGPKTKVAIENPSLDNILNDNQFDTVYHEHFSYLTARAVSYLAESVGLSLIDIEHIDTHGGSLRYWLSREPGDESSSQRVKDQISFEFQAGLFAPEPWLEREKSIKSHLEKVKDFFLVSKQSNFRIFGYGAAAKASTLINAAGLTYNDILGIFDASPEKANKFMPVLNIPVVSTNRISEFEIDLIVIFPWNISNEIITLLNGRVSQDTQIWRMIPKIERLK